MSSFSCLNIRSLSLCLLAMTCRESGEVKQSIPPSTCASHLDGVNSNLPVHGSFPESFAQRYQACSSGSFPECRYPSIVEWNCFPTAEIAVALLYAQDLVRSSFQAAKHPQLPCKLKLGSQIWPQVECPQLLDQENLTPRRVLDQQGSNDFTAYMQEHAGSPIFRYSLTASCSRSSRAFAAVIITAVHASLLCFDRLQLC